MAKNFNCVDAGTEYCPCILADTMDCITCSQLQGREFCDCEWNGVCILNEYYMNNKKVKDSRKDYKGMLIEKKKIEDKLYLLKIETEKELVKELNRAGSYIILRGSKDKEYFNVPMSILKTENNKYISILYKIRGSKTKALNNNIEYIIRGPYWNGILGARYLKEIKDSNCLVISKGMGQASINLTIEEMIRNNNNVILFLDPGEFKNNYINNFTSLEKIKIIEGKIEKDTEIIMKLIENENVKLVFSAGSDLLHESIYKIIKNTNENIKFMTTNNSKICCGEGVCGACTNRIKEGQRVKLCKAKIQQKIFY
ncbi:sulfide/dihydroorotate dehydrogenase-like FAD/NAD-binding protein [Anaerosalibacter massiliensis]|uniref:Sulfide/dihydroorotate dehydrogenase-like FAD/NAD-binding protein n=1 Tax=Anaerosalibacter massiliensis TaxID=1347392 RepID=A0A9X2MEJ9_9FIRM|nr:sulfide/dihydroorotate dehydrogenase-like FAD/NAD-binding protein [Anaerosalibacter massiliensis]MCR2042648.1 sulfide/dihydroorotate dehydrogenase-like FAD/NAD-binding protein [Anaerosalibacter massiliensis]